MAWQINALVAKPEETHMVEGKNWLPQAVLGLSHMHHGIGYIYMTKRVSPNQKKNSGVRLEQHLPFTRRPQVLVSQLQKEEVDEEGEESLILMTRNTSLCLVMPGVICRKYMPGSVWLKYAERPTGTLSECKPQEVQICNGWSWVCWQSQHAWGSGRPIRVMSLIHLV